MLFARLFLARNAREKSEAEPLDMRYQAEPIGDNLRLKPLINLVYMPSLDPPRIPLKKGDFEKTPVPPFLRGARGDLSLIVKQQSVDGFELKLSPMDRAWKGFSPTKIIRHFLLASGSTTYQLPLQIPLVTD